MADKRHAVHARHVEIANDDVDGSAAADLERRSAIGGFPYLDDAESLQHSDQHAALEVVIIDD